MSKKIISILFVLLLFIATFLPSFALSEEPRLIDEADILTNGEESSLLSKLDKISEKHEFDVVILIVEDIGIYSPQEYAETIYEAAAYGYGENYDGIMLLLSMAERDWFMLPNGFGEEAFTYPCIEYISEKFLPALGEDEYAEGFEIYAELCDEFIAQAKEGEPYGENNLPKEPFNFLFSIIIALVIGFVIAFVVTAVMKAKLKSVRSRAAAEDYLKRGSMKLTSSGDYFLYRQLIRTAKPKSNSTGGATFRGSGRGGGGKF